MAAMTDEEADALDELWTRTTPKLSGKPGYYTTHMAHTMVVDNLTAQWVDAMSEKTHKSATEIISELVREKIAASA
ncbi:hypothetical protein TREPR_1409 [Treponema primitia ZAS-2]|uniref:Uncharacterized protein n=1 Tax=Treponema primitia (strain ATCC BAA-887 / DSM 12427 / ZAS-2) TaxID=545694 RepID=F5YQ80_TREPZ|nr:hypothetical protein [Treponema primitia]AEF84675.1 hypothetical protein TREPR_1409 [Treponema primitia ZAS-2]